MKIKVVLRANTIYYDVVEVDREIVSTGAATSAGSASVTVEYCE